MKNLKTTLALAFVFGISIATSLGQGTKLAYADFEYILAKLPQMRVIESELQTEQQQLEALLASIQQEVLDLQGQLENKSQPAAVLQKLESDYRMKVQQFELESGMAEQNLMKKQQELLGPILDSVQVIIEEVAKEKGYNMVINNTLAANPIVLYADVKDNISLDILKKMGVDVSAEEATLPQPNLNVSGN